MFLKAAPFMPSRYVRLFIIVEGQTELAVFKQLLVPYLGNKGIQASPYVIGKPGKKGGTKPFSVLLGDIQNLAKSNQGCFITTFFDYYALNSKWPSVNEAKDTRNAVSAAVRAERIEDALTKAVHGKISSDTLWDGHFLPYIQIHELESLLFAGPDEMARVFFDPNLEIRFRSIVEQCGGCEEINDNPATAPSKRISAIFPGYMKGKSASAHAPIIASRIGLKNITVACPRFRQWVERLVMLAQPSTA